MTDSFSGDNWDSVYSITLQTNGSASIVYFFFLVVFGTYFVLKLMIAVIADAYGKEIDIIEAKHKEKQEKRLLRRQARITKKAVKKDAIGASSNLKPDLDGVDDNDLSLPTNVKTVCIP